ncbi:MAG: DASS family sodium-coupled anion symporter, partial [Epsilonproteobacteria bacterium]|nr:DASS family sodium-coupled anion symporter [Campylobacterota bacterium]
MSKQAISMLVPVLVMLVVWFLPAPEGLSANAWHFMAIFLGVVVGLVLEPVPAALVGLVGVCLVALMGIIDPKPAEGIKWALSGFSNSIIWLIFAAFMFAAGYQKTGLGKRISLIMVKFMGKSSLGLGYAVAFADLLLAPFMPSNTARSGGTIFPIAINIPQIFNSLPDNEPRKLGSYITWVAMAATCVTSSMFLTALAPNLLAVDLIAKSAKVSIEWGAWAKVMIPLMLPLFLLTPLLAYIVYPPTQKQSPEAPIWAANELKKMGSITFKEIMMLLFAVLALVLWIFGKELSVDATTAAVSIVALMVLCKVISWEDVIGNKGAWNVLVWFSTLVALAGGLGKV